MMRVALLLENAGAGSGRHVLDLAGGLAASGDEVHLLYSSGRIEAAFERELAALEGVVTHCFAMQRIPGPADLPLVLRVRRYLARCGPFDVVHGHSSKGGAVARLAALGTSIAAVYTPHAFFTLNPSLGRAAHALYAGAERALARLTDAVICVSTDERIHAEQVLEIAPERLAVVGHGLRTAAPVQREALRAGLGIEHGQVAIGFVGRFAPQKDLGNLLYAFAHVARLRDDAVLVMAGDGEEGARLRRLASRLGIDDRVVWPGTVDGARVVGAFDMFALSSRYEGYPYVLCEAIRAGVPVVTTRVGGASDTVRGGACGLMVEPDDPAALADALLRLCDEPGTRATMAAAAAARRDDYAIDSMVAAVRQVYAAALARRRGQASVADIA